MRRRCSPKPLEPRHAVGDGRGDDGGAAVGGLPELHHAGERLPGDCVPGDLRHGVGVDHDPAVADCLPPQPRAEEQAGKLQFALPGGSATAWVGLLFLVFIIGLIGYLPDTRISLYVGSAWIVLLLLAWPLAKKRKA